MPTMPLSYYQRFDPTKNYDEHLFIAGAGLQSAELNEIQKNFAYRLTNVAKTILKDGDIVRDCQIVVASDGTVTIAAGEIYLGGQVRQVPAASFVIPTTGTIAIGVYLVSTVVYATDDPGLLDPANGTRNYQMPGADRLRVVPSWGYSGDGNTGDFYPVYVVVDGELQSKEAPPSFDGINQALAKYDRDSTGGSYVVSGLNVLQLTDSATDVQTYSVSEGRARVSGFGYDFPTSKRLSFDAQPDLRRINSEPHLSANATSQRVDLDRGPVAALISVSITTEITESVVHGGYVGFQDPLQHSSVLSLIEVKQGGTTYTAGVDYQLTAGKVDWSLAGIEPATGSTYTCKYQYIATVTPTGVDESGYTVAGAVVGTQILTTYDVKMLRIDKLALNNMGQFEFVKGISADFYPFPPQLRPGILPVAQITQTWKNTRVTANDGTRMVPMNDLVAINKRIDSVVALIALGRLEQDMAVRESGIKKGMEVDPFIDDTVRDQGTSQTAAIVDGDLILPLTVSAYYCGSDITVPTSMAFTEASAIQQLSKTGDMKVNPYMALVRLPARTTLFPANDYWTDKSTVFSSHVAKDFLPSASLAVNDTALIGTTATINGTKILAPQINTTKSTKTLRAINVGFVVDGFGGNEVLQSVKIDGLVATFS